MTAIDTSFIDTRALGKATVTVVSEGTLRWDPRFPGSESERRAAMPDADEEGRVWLGLNVVIVQLSGATIVIDPGLDDPDSDWQRARPKVWPDFPVTRTAGLAAALDQLGIAPESVTDVVITHPHGDHYAGITFDRDGELNARFPRARHFIGRADWEGNPHRGEPESDTVRLELAERLGLLNLVDDQLEIRPGVTIYSAPGESPGHVIVRVESDRQVLYVVGDLFHHAAEVEHGEWAPPHADHMPLMASRGRWYKQIAGEEATVVTAHERFPPWGRITLANGGYRWQRSESG